MIFNLAFSIVILCEIIYLIWRIVSKQVSLKDSGGRKWLKNSIIRIAFHAVLFVILGVAIRLAWFIFRLILYILIIAAILLMIYLWFRGRTQSKKSRTKR